MRYYNLAVTAGSGVTAAAYIPEFAKGNDSAKVNELYTYQTVKLTNLCPEL